MWKFYLFFTAYCGFGGSKVSETERGFSWKPTTNIFKSKCIKRAVIFNAGYRGGRILEIDGKISLPHSLYSVICETSF